MYSANYFCVEMGKYVLLLAFTMLFACKHDTKSGGITILGDKDVADGLYCAEIIYFNPNTRNSSIYELKVRVEKAHLVEIDWPSDGWIDYMEVSAQKIVNGMCVFKNSKGFQFTVILGSKGGECYDDGLDLQQEVNNDAAKMRLFKLEKPLY